MVGNTNQVFISNKVTQKVVVGPHIKKIILYGDIVLGELHKPNKYEDATVVEGYFIFDTKNKILMQGLDQHSWEKGIKKCGINPKDIKLDLLHQFSRKLNNNEYLKDTNKIKGCK